MALDAKTLDPVVKYCAVGRQLGYAGYLSLDALTFLDAAGIRKSPNTKRLQQQAYRFWMVGLLFSAVSGGYSLYNLRLQQTRVDKKDGEGALATKRIEKYVPRSLPECDLYANDVVLGSVRLPTSNLFPIWRISASPPRRSGSPASMTGSSVWQERRAV